MFRLGRGAGYAPMVLAELPINPEILRRKYGPAVVHSATFQHKYPGWALRDEANNETVEIAIIRGKVVAAVPDYEEVADTAERFLAFVSSLTQPAEVPHV